MQTLIANHSLKCLPTATAIVDPQFRIMEYSNILAAQFGNSKNQIKGKKIQEVLTDIPKEFIQDLKTCLTDEKIIESRSKKYFKDQQPKWMKWGIGPWKNEEDKVNGLVITLEDVTVTKRNEELFARGEAVSSTGSWEMDLSSNTLYWSPMTKKIHEVSSDYEPLLEEGINFYKEGESREKITKAVNDAMENGTPWDLELIVVTQKGKEVWVRAKGDIETLDGKPVRLFGTFQDIDKEKKAELKYTETSERLQIATEASQMGIWELLLANNTVVCNENMYNIYGISKDSSNILEDWLERIHPEDKETVKSSLEDTIKNKSQFNIQFRAIKPNNEIVHIIAKARPLVDENGNVVKVIGSNWDITELKQTRQKLERSKDLFSETFQNSAVGMALVDKSGNWIRVNETLCHSLGYKEAELLELTFKDVTHPDDLAFGVAHYNDALEGKRDSYQLEKRYLHKNGDTVHAILTATVVRKINGQFSHFITQVLDITQRQKAEEKLSSLLKVTKTQNESLFNFAHIVSHNLRSHSTNLAMLTNFLLEETNDKERQNITQMMINASDTLTETIHHLNEVVQIKTSPTEKMERIHLASLLETIEKSIEVLLLEKKATIHKNVAQSHKIVGVPAYLDSIFLNLYTNSIKYRNTNKDLKININSKEIENTISIDFTDNGQGIDLERHGNKIFGMYKTFHKHEDSKGIGLFITKNQTESMGGKISVQSTVGEGTTFTLTFNKA